MAAKLQRMVGLLIGVAVMAFTVPAASQVTTATISGTVKDSSGSVVPGVRVSVTHVERGASQNQATDEVGRFIFPQLALGEYEVRAEQSGFRTEIRRGIILTVGREAVVNLSLQVGEVAESVVVEGEAPLVETTSSSVAGLVGEREVRDLPLNGRSFDQLITLQAGALQVLQHDAGAPAGLTAAFSVGGTRWETTKYLMDGVEYVGASSLATLPNTASGKLVGVEAVREFSVISNNGDASVGKKFGGQVNIVTRSGSNSFHGSIYWFLRNNHLDARNFFDPGEVPPFKQNNFGAAGGGPLRKDRSWFFANYEGFRRRLGLSSVHVVPDADARRGILPLPDPGNPGQRIPTFVGLAPGVADAMAAFFPAPSKSLGDGNALAFASPTEKADQDFVLSRLDHKLSAVHDLFGSYLIDDSELVNPRENANFSQFAPFRNQLASVGLKSVLSPVLLNSFTLGFARGAGVTDLVANVPIPPSMIFVPGGSTMGNIRVPGLVSSQNSLPAPRPIIRNVFTISDQPSISHGRHFFQLGGRVERIQANEDQGTTKLGEFQFNSLLDFMQGRAILFRGPGPSQSNAVKGWRQSFVSFFVQDSLKVVPTFTLNLGLRYEFMSNPSEVNGRATGFDFVDGQLTNPLRTEPFVTDTVFARNNSRKGLAPRVGFAWDVTGRSTTALRGGFGMFYSQVEDDFRRFGGSNPPFFSVFSRSNVTFPATTAILTSGGAPRPESVTRTLEVPTLLQYNLRIEQMLRQNLRASASYVGSHGYHLSRTSDPQITVPTQLSDGRLFYPLGTTVRNRALGSNGTIVIYDANSFYNSFQLDVEQRLQRGLRFKVAYTLSKSVDDSSATLRLSGSNPLVLVTSDHKFDRALSSFDATQNLAFNWSYELPLAKSNRLLGGWELNGILSLQDGSPFTVEVGFTRSRNGSTQAERPDLSPGANSNSILGPPQESLRYFDATAFVLQPEGFIGNLGRNTLRGPGIVNLDLTLQKQFRWTEAVGLQIRAEAFNLFNRANFATPNGRQLFDRTGARLSSAGLITATSTSSRQIQFGLKATF